VKKNKPPNPHIHLIYKKNKKIYLNYKNNWVKVYNIQKVRGGGRRGG